MAGRAVSGGRFLNLHASMTPYALLVIGRNQTRANRLSFNKRLTVTASALGRFLSDNTVMVTPLAQGSRLAVEYRRQLVALNLFLECLHDFSMRHLGFLKLI